MACHRRCSILSAIGFALAVGGAGACGLDVTGSGAADSTATLPYTPAAPSGEGASAAAATEGSASPAPSATDGGIEAGRGAIVFACLSSKDCKEERVCCFGGTTGTSCKKTCAPAERALCVVGADSCGEKKQCVPTEALPVVGVGTCEADGR